MFPIPSPWIYAVFSTGLPYVSCLGFAFEITNSLWMQDLPGPLLTSGSHGSSGGSTDGEQVSGQKYAVGWWRQYRVLLWRCLLSYTRNPSDVAGRIFMAIGTSLVGGLVFINSVKGNTHVPLWSQVQMLVYKFGHFWRVGHLMNFVCLGGSPCQ